MAIIALDGFDLDNTESALERRYPGSTIAGSGSVVDDDGRLGGRCLKSTLSQQHVIVIDHKNYNPVGGTSQLYNLGIAIKLSTPSSTFSYDMVEVYDSSGDNVAARIRLIADGTSTTGFNLQYHGSSVFDLKTDLSKELAYNTWWYVELEVELGSPTSPKSRLLINDQVMFKYSGGGINGLKGYNKTQLKLVSANNDVFIDDFYINTGGDPGILGSETRVSSSVPDGDNFIEWFPTGGNSSGDNFDTIDELGEADDYDTFVTNIIDGDKDIYTMSNFDGIGGAVYGIEYAIDTVSNDETVHTIYPVLNLSNEEILDPVYSGMLSESWTRISIKKTTDPTTGMAIGIDRLLDVKAGFRASKSQYGGDFLLMPIALSDDTLLGNVFLDGADDWIINQQMVGQGYRVVASDESGIPVELSDGSAVHIILEGDAVRPRASFKKSDPIRYDGFYFPTAGDPRYYQITHYVSSLDTNSWTYDVQIELSYPAPIGGVSIPYSVSGTGTTNTYTITPWEIDSAYNSPIVIPEGSTTGTIRVTVPALAIPDYKFTNTHKEYSLIFKIYQDEETDYRTHGTTDEFRLYMKQADYDSLSTNNTAQLIGKQFPPLIRSKIENFYALSPSVNDIVDIMIFEGHDTVIGGPQDVNFNYPYSNDPVYLYWKVDVNTIFEGWGRDNEDEVSGMPTTGVFTDIAGSRLWATAIKDDGSIVSWGEEKWDNIQGTPSGTGFLQVAAGDYHGVALKTDGSIVCWGFNSDGQTDGPTGNDFVQVTAGGPWPAGGSSAAIKTNGSIVQWGYLDQSGSWHADPPAGSDFVEISMGNSFGLALKDDGTIVGWGNDSQNQLGNIPPGSYVKIAAGGYFGVAIKTDGTLAAWGQDNEGQVANVPSGSGWVDITCGGRWGLARKANGSLAQWGYSGTDLNTDTPPGTGFTLIAASNQTAYALKTSLAEGTKWKMVDHNGDDITQGSYNLQDSYTAPPLTSLNRNVPRCFIKLLSTDTGFIKVKFDYEQVKVSMKFTSIIDAWLEIVERLNENLWAKTQTWSPMRSGWGIEYFPDGSGGNVVCNSTLSPVYDDEGILTYAGNVNPCFTTVVDSTKEDSQGNKLPVFEITDDYTDGSKNINNVRNIPYVRIDLSGQYDADGSVDYYPVKKGTGNPEPPNTKAGYTLAYVKITDPSADTLASLGKSVSPFVRLALRDKSANIQVQNWNRITHPGVDSQAFAMYIRNGSNNWSVYDTGETPTDVTKPYAGVINNTDHSILWLLREDEEKNIQKYAGINFLIRPMWHTNSDIRDNGLIDRCVCLYEPFLQTYDVIPPTLTDNGDGSHTMTLPDWWPVLGNHWEPRGNAVMLEDSESANLHYNYFILTVG